MRSIMHFVYLFGAILLFGHSVKSQPIDNSTSAKEIPSFLKVCHKKDPKLSDCVNASIELLRPKLGKGVPELMIPPCEPLLIPQISIQQNGGAIRMESEFTDIVINGMSNFTLRYIRIDPETNKFRMKLWFPTLAMTSNYHVNGKLLLLPLAGSGTCKGNFSDIDATISMKHDIVKTNGTDHLKVNEILVDFNIGAATVELNNLFNGDAELGTMMNKFLNDNWKEITAEMRPALANSIESILRNIVSRIFDIYPLTQILPD